VSCSPSRMEIEAAAGRLENEVRMSDRIASALAYMASGLVGAFGVLTVQEWAAVGGLIVAVATYLVNRNHKKAMREIHRKRLELLRQLGIPDSDRDMSDD